MSEWPAVASANRRSYGRRSGIGILITWGCGETGIPHFALWATRGAARSEYYVGVAELVYAYASGAYGFTALRVQLPPSTQKYYF